MNKDINQPAANGAAGVALTRGRALAWALAFVVPCYLLVLFGHDLWRPAEAREAGIAREMIESGNWSATHLNGMLFLEKPPLYTWALAASLRLFGYSAWAVRLPVLLFAVGTLLLTFLLAARRLEPAGALAATLVLATMWLFVEVNRGAMIDNGLVCFITLAMLAFERMGDGRRRSAAWAVLFYAALGLAFLTKGGIGVALVAAALAAYAAWDRPRPAWHAWFPLTGLLTLAVLVGGWLLALWRRGGAEYFEVFFIRHHLVRFLGLTPYHPEGYPTAPWHYYLSYLVTGPAPWTLLIPAGLWVAAGQARRDPSARRYWRLLAGWVLGMLVLLSVARSKDNQYLLPLFPPLAVLAGAWIAHRVAGRPAPRWAGVLTALTVALPAAVVWTLPLAPAALGLRRWTVVAWVLAAALAWGGGLTLRALVRRDWPRMWVRLAMLALAAVGAFAVAIKPAMNAVKSSRMFCARVADALPPGATLYGYRLNENVMGALIFYGLKPARLVALHPTRDLGTNTAPAGLLLSPGEDPWADCARVLRSGDWRVLRDLRDGKRAFRLLGNRAAWPEEHRAPVDHP